jgi:MOSC domain-containing protein YiiM
MQSVSSVTEIKHLYVSPGHSFFGNHGKEPAAFSMAEVAEVRLRAGRGIEGDRFLDYKANYKGQITFFAEEIYDELCARLDVWDRDPSVFRRNVITRNLDLNSLIGVEFELQGVRFMGTEESRPCYWMDRAFAPGAEEALTGNGGLRARILTDGVLRASGGRA